MATPEQRIARLEESLAGLAALAAALPSRTEAERAIHMEEELGRLARLAIIPLIIAVIGVFWAGWMTIQGNELVEANRQAVQCVLAEFAEHRNSNELAHDGLIEAVDASPTPETIIPMRLSYEEIEELCEPFYEHRLSQRRE